MILETALEYFAVMGFQTVLPEFSGVSAGLFAHGAPEHLLKHTTKPWSYLSTEQVYKTV